MDRNDDDPDGCVKEAKYPSLHEAIVLKDSVVSGFGLFATRDIDVGEICWRNTMKDPGYEHDIEEMFQWSREKLEDKLHYSFQATQSTYIGPFTRDGALEDASCFMNHSCDPNCWYDFDESENEHVMTFRRAIKAGEELTYDYGTSETLADFPEHAEFSGYMICLCGTEKCRGVVSPNDWKNESLRKEYGSHWAPYILEMIERQGDDESEIVENSCLENVAKGIILKKSKISGYGLFAERDFEKGEVCWRENQDTEEELLHTVEEILQWAQEKIDMKLHYSYQVAENVFSGPSSFEEAMKDAANFMNHSCDPSVWFDPDDEKVMIFRRNITAGEEITYDYGTSECFSYWGLGVKYQGCFDCQCGTSLCRGTVTFHDWKDETLQNRYGRHWSTTILKLMDQDVATSSGATTTPVMSSSSGTGSENESDLDLNSLHI